MIPGCRRSSVHFNYTAPHPLPKGAFSTIFPTISYFKMESFFLGWQEELTCSALDLFSINFEHKDAVNLILHKLDIHGDFLSRLIYHNFSFL